MATIRDKFDEICNILNLNDYYDKGYKGQNVIIASVESTDSDHGSMVKDTIKTYAPNCKLISFNDEHINKSATGDNNVNQSFPLFVDWCIENKVDIVTSSLDWSCDKESELKAIQKLYDNGIIFCNCAGNDGHEIFRSSLCRTYSLDEEIISVSGLGLDSKGKITWAGFNYGEPVDVVTFGSLVPTLDKDGHWYSWSGTSVATPLFASLLALVKSTGFKLTSKGVFALIDMYNKPFNYKDRDYKMFVLPPINELLSRVDNNPSKGDDINMDNNKPSDWAVEAVNYMKEIGITDGTRLKDTITREEVITLLYRLIQKIKKDYE